MSKQANISAKSRAKNNTPTISTTAFRLNSRKSCRMPRKTGAYKPSRRYRELSAKVDANKRYTLDEAIALLKSGQKKCKFDESVDLAIKLDIDTKQADQLVRGSFSLPKGTGKTMRVICRRCMPCTSRDRSNHGCQACTHWRRPVRRLSVWPTAKSAANWW